MSVWLPSKVIAALLAPAVLVASAAQGLMLMRCGASIETAASCCCHKDQGPASDNEVVAGASQCCARLAVPATQPQIGHRSVPPLPAQIAVAVAQEPLPFIRALQRAPLVPGLDPPAAPSPLLNNCSLLI